MQASVTATTLGKHSPAPWAALTRSEMRCEIPSYSRLRHSHDTSPESADPQSPAAAYPHRARSCTSSDHMRRKSAAPASSHPAAPVSDLLYLVSTPDTLAAYRQDPPDLRRS